MGAGQRIGDAVVKTFDFMNLKYDAYIGGWRDSFRWWLTRPVPVRPDRPPLVVCMLNPSTADAERDDQTIRKLYGFASRYDRGGLVVVNAYAFRARHPRDLRAAFDPVGSLNDETLRMVAGMLRKFPLPHLMVAWGRHCEPERAREVSRILSDEGARLMSWGTNNDGSPPHPLMIPYSTKIQPWSPP